MLSIHGYGAEYVLNVASCTTICITHIKSQNTRMSMTGQHHCMLAFEGTLFSHGRTQKFSFDSPAVFSSNGATVCIRSTDDDGRIAGYIKFDSTPDGARKRAISLWDEFQKSMILNGLKLEKSSDPELRKMAPDGKQTKTVSSTLTIEYSIDVLTTEIGKDKVQKIEEVFANLPLDGKLKDVGCYLMEERKIGENVADFFLSWINFNKKYCVYKKLDKEYERIEKYINDLDDDEVSFLRAKHESFVRELAQAKIVDRNKNSRSDTLQWALCTSSDKQIMKKATLCVYELRNCFAHEGTFNFDKITQAATFIRELTYLKLYFKYKI